MATTDVRTSRRIVRWAVVPALLIALAACGGTKTDVSQATAAINKLIADEGIKGVTVSCPTTIDGGDGAKFSCTINGPGGTETVQMAVQGDAVDVTDQAAFEAALIKVAGTQ